MTPRPSGRAAILAVGSELLTPFRTDTNSLLITEQLNAAGIEVVFKAIAGDERDELAHAVRSALARADVVVVSGGLGPTDDDVTRDVVASVLALPMTEDAAIVEGIRTRFAARGWTMPEINRRQAMVPAGAQIIPNANGTAPGLWIEDGDRVIVLLPGPPRELAPMLAHAVERLRGRTSGQTLLRCVLRISGRTESHTEEAVRGRYPVWAAQAVPVSATILASLGQIELHLTARAASAAAAEDALRTASREVAGILGPDVYSLDGRLMEQVVGDLLVERRYRISVGESCTGGLIASRLTDVPGSSRYVDRGVVCYSNAAKTELLGVPPALIAAHGAVSEPVAAAMAEGARKLGGCDVGIGVTGIAGPDGGSAEKPVGTVAFAVAAPEGSRVRTARFMGERGLIKFQASQAALDMVRRILSGDTDRTGGTHR